jgi:hypothetical protein
MENLKAEADERKAQMERHSEGDTITYSTPEEEIAGLRFNIRCLTQDLKNYATEVRELKRYRQAYDALVLKHVTEIARLNQLLSGRGE